MSGKISNRIVTDGLVLYVDAANPKSYISGSTLWNDLTINNFNSTLINGPSYNPSNSGGILFDGINDYVKLGPAVFTMAPTNVTMLFWINGNYQNYFLGIFRRDISVGSGLNVPIPNNGWIQVGYSNNGSTNYFIINGVQYLANTGGRYPYDNPNDKTIFSSNPVNYFDQASTSNISFNFQTASGGFSSFAWLDQNYRIIGALNTFASVRYLSGTTSNALFYNRTLNQNEITQNYNAMVRRFI